MSDYSAQEVDNCPRCNATVVLSHGFVEGAYESGLDDTDTEIEYGICKICDIRFRRREDLRNRKLIAVYEEWTGGVWLEVHTKEVPFADHL